MIVCRQDTDSHKHCLHYHPRTQFNSYQQVKGGWPNFTKHSGIKKTFVVLFVYGNHLNKPIFDKSKISFNPVSLIYIRIWLGKTKVSFSLIAKGLGRVQCGIQLAWQKWLAQNLHDFHRPKTCCTNDPIYIASPLVSGIFLGTGAQRGVTLHCTAGYRVSTLGVKICLKN